MKVLVADKFEESGLEGLKGLGCEVLYEPKLEGETLGARLTESRADVLVVRSTKVTAAEIEKATGLSLIVRAGAGVNTIDLAAASARAVAVSNCPGKNAIAVAELAWGLLLALDRRLVDQAVDLRNGVWNKAEYGKARGLAGRTLGVIGLGAIGLEVVTRAQAFGMPVVAWSRSLDDDHAERLGLARADSIHALAAASDAVSIHCALTKETKGFLDAKFFEALKPGAFFVNTSRGEIVDAAALRKAIAERGIRAGLDVFEKEPAGGSGTFEDGIVKFPGVVGTHHVGAST
jgi:D-3-phosphoglycerate dehydrogenase